MIVALIKVSQYLNIPLQSQIRYLLERVNNSFFLSLSFFNPHARICFLILEREGEERERDRERYVSHL